MNAFRDLNTDEIEVRVQNATEKGATLLLYKNSRVDMALLDEVVGPENWQRCHTEIKGRLFCDVEIRTEDGRWIDKQDCGTESSMEKEKGEASDAFKRACTNWGIGRELYTAPHIFIPSDKCTISRNKQGNPACYDHFYVSDIQTKDHKITALSISKAGGGEVFRFPKEGNQHRFERKEAPKEEKTEEKVKSPRDVAYEFLVSSAKKYTDKTGEDARDYWISLSRDAGKPVSHWTVDELNAKSKELMEAVNG